MSKKVIALLNSFLNSIFLLLVGIIVSPIAAMDFPAGLQARAAIDCNAHGEQAQINQQNYLNPRVQFHTVESEEEVEVCSICLDNDEEKAFAPQEWLSCGHAPQHHADCLRTWLVQNASCPLCRIATRVPEFARNNAPVVNQFNERPQIIFIDYQVRIDDVAHEEVHVHPNLREVTALLNAYHGRARMHREVQNRLGPEGLRMRIEREAQAHARREEAQAHAEREAQREVQLNAQQMAQRRARLLARCKKLLCMGLCLTPWFLGYYVQDMNVISAINHVFSDIKDGTKYLVRKLPTIGKYYMGLVALEFSCIICFEFAQQNHSPFLEEILGFLWRVRRRVLNNL